MKDSEIAGVDELLASVLRKTRRAGALLEENLNPEASGDVGDLCLPDLERARVLLAEARTLLRTARRTTRRAARRPAPAAAVHGITSRGGVA